MYSVCPHPFQILDSDFSENSVVQTNRFGVVTSTKDVVERGSAIMFFSLNFVIRISKNQFFPCKK